MPESKPPYALAPGKCPTCGGPVHLNEDYDADACLTCGKWLDPKCSTPDCDLCGPRPGVPPSAPSDGAS